MTAFLVDAQHNLSLAFCGLPHGDEISHIPREFPCWCLERPYCASPCSRGAGNATRPTYLFKMCAYCVLPCPQSRREEAEVGHGACHGGPAGNPGAATRSIKHLEPYLRPCGRFILNASTRLLSRLILGNKAMAEPQIPSNAFLP